MEPKHGSSRGTQQRVANVSPRLSQSCGKARSMLLSQVFWWHMTQPGLAKAHALFLDFSYPMGREAF